MKYLIGIDIGGTKISATLGSTTGKIIAKQIIPTKTHAQSSQSAHELISNITYLLKQKRIKQHHILGIGVGVPGPVHPAREQIEDSPNLKGWTGIPLKALLKRRFGIPVFIENDANAAALGVKYFGEGRGIQDFIYITVSTGIGSGIILNGKLVRGMSGAAGEFGHTTIEIGGEKCSCGKRGCVEAYASGTAIGRLATRLLNTGRKSLIRQYCAVRNVITGQAVSQAAKAGDQLAIEIRKRAGEYFGVGIGNLINLLNPERIILGGGVLADPNYFWGAMMKSVRKEAWAFSPKNCKIVKTKLGNQVGDLGAMAVALERLNLRP